MKFSVDVVIAGAGIVGAACAFELASAGLRVAVMEEKFAGAGATGAAMGHVVTMDDSEAQFALTRYSQVLWNEVRAELPANVEFDRCGTMWIATDEQQILEAHKKCEYYQTRGVPAEIIDSQGLRDAEPHLRTPLPGGVLIREDSVVHPPTAAAFLLQRAADRDAQLHFGKAIVAFGRGQAHLSDGTVFTAKYLINATGSLAAKLTPGVQIRPRKGHLVITDRYPGTVHHQLVELGYLRSAHSLTSDSVAFNVQPRKTGQLLIGSSRQYDVEGDEVETATLSSMLSRAFEFMPRLRELSAIRVWTGFRPATPDKLPLIGPWPGDASVYLATGHEGLGITTSLGTARLIRAQLLDETPPISTEPYLPSRYVPSRHQVETHA
jgi:D-hydroxyproline dehydrogenase subunit beta